MALNRTELATNLGVALSTIDDWVRRGCPIIQRADKENGKGWLFDCGMVAKWERANRESSDAEELKLRKLEAETQKVELELAIAKGDVSPIKEFENVQARLMAGIRQNILNVPNRVVLQLLGETDEQVFKAKLRAELSAALEQSAELSFDLDDESLDD